MKRPLAVICLAVLAAACFKMKLAPPDFPVYRQFEGTDCTAAGRIGKIEIKNHYGKNQTVLYLESLSYFQSDQEPFYESKSPDKQKIKSDLPCGLVCYIDGGENEGTPDYRIGEEALVRGRFEAYRAASNPGEFDACRYYRILGISGKLKNAGVLQTGKDYNRPAHLLYRFKTYLQKKIHSYYPQKEAGIMTTMLLGDKTELDREIKDLYKTAGILHILSVSGLHVSLLGYGLYKGLRRIGVPMRTAAAAGGIWIAAYGVMIGSGVSVFRAVFMFCLQMLAEWWGRTYDLLTALSVSAAFLILKNPLYLYHSGFWLSYTCVLAISLLYPCLKVPEEKGNVKVIAVLNSFLLSVSITIATLPVFLWFYYEVSLWGIMWNLLVIPLMSVVLGGGIFTLFLPEAIKGFAGIAARGICLPLTLFEKLCHITEWTGLGTIIAGQPDFWQIAVFTAGLLCFLAVSGKLRYVQRMAVLSVLITVLFLRPRPGFTITFLDVGQGDGICVQNENGNVYLIDGGSSSKSNVGTYQILPFLKQQGIREIKAVFISHGDQDHINGIRELLERQKGGVAIRQLVLSGSGRQEFFDEYRELIKLCEETGTGVYTIQAGGSVTDGGLTLACLHPAGNFEGEKNASSQVLYLSYEDVTVLFTGDVEGEGERRLEQAMEEAEIKNITLLKVAHHGSKYSTSPQFLRQVNPKASIISCGENNSYGHPHEELLERLKEQGCPVLQTQENGAITVSLRKGRMWFYVFGHG